MGVLERRRHRHRPALIRSRHMQGHPRSRRAHRFCRGWSGCVVCRSREGGALLAWCVVGVYPERQMCRKSAEMDPVGNRKIPVSNCPAEVPQFSAGTTRARSGRLSRTRTAAAANLVRFRVLSLELVVARRSRFRLSEHTERRWLKWRHRRPLESQV